MSFFSQWICKSKTNSNWNCVLLESLWNMRGIKSVMFPEKHQMRKEICHLRRTTSFIKCWLTLCIENKVYEKKNQEWMLHFSYLRIYSYFEPSEYFSVTSRSSYTQVPLYRWYFRGTCSLYTIYGIYKYEISILIRFKVFLSRREGE